ncbi:MAG TPA: hypothetical protein VKZ18_18790 [Polyangia bacterium]|nr:hypothetical protein [Polyangia bacterium]
MTGQLEAVFGRARSYLSLAVALLSFAPGCAHRAGQQAAQGALAELQQQQANRTGPPPSKIIAQNTIDGVMTALDTPEQQARIERLVSLAVAAATKTAVEDLSTQLASATRTMVDGMSAQVAAATRTMIAGASDQLMQELGPTGSGPLAVSLSNASQRMSASAAGGLVGGVVDGAEAELAGLAPECRGPNRAACLQQRLQQALLETTQTAAAAFSKGVRDSIGWQLLLVAFALGVAGGVLGSWLFSVLLSLRHERRSFRTA